MQIDTPPLHYDIIGTPDLPTLLLLNGAGCPDTFCHQYAFSERFRLIVPHLPGSGYSVMVPYHPEDTVNALAALVRSLDCGKVSVMGHSLGGELAVALVSAYPELFDRAVFLSAWVCATPHAAARYAALSERTYALLQNETLLRLQARYWGMNAAQGNNLITSALAIPRTTYSAFFRNRILLDELPSYADAELPMLAMCAIGETREMKQSLSQLGLRNKRCRTLTFPLGRHDFVLRHWRTLNPILLSFLTDGQ